MKLNFRLNSIFFAVFLIHLNCQANPITTNTVTSNTTVTERSEAAAGMSWGKATNNYKEGTGQFLRFSTNLDKTRIDTELVHQQRFQLNGSQAKLTVHQPVNSNNHISLGLSSGNSKLFAKTGVNLSWAHRWLKNETFISRIGVQYYDWRENRNQKGVSFEQVWYAPWNGIVQIGRTQGNSNPGNVSIHSNYIAHTWLLKNNAQLLFRYEQAREGYMALGETNEIVDFDSKTLSLGLSYPIYKNNQLQWRWDRYQNPFYQRNTLSGAWSLQW